ncbi:WD40 repeat-like protein [Neoconidiobolus thromboides FSU 785]|nr:WD40 repeat-like protein [Neoconidiobolus thromboides FSU 785]
MRLFNNNNQIKNNKNKNKEQKIITPDIGEIKPVQRYYGFKSQVNYILKKEYEGKTLLILGGADKTVKVIDLSSFKTIFAIKNFPEEISCIAINPTKKYSNHLYIVSLNHIYVFDLNSKKLILDCLNKKDVLKDIIILEEDINQIAINSQGKLLAAVNDDGKVIVIDIESENTVSRFEDQHKNVAFTVLFHPTKNEIISGGMDYSIKFWKLKDELPYYELQPKNTNLSEHSNQLINPPFVLCSSYHISLDILAFGLGNGSLYLMKYKKPENNWQSYQLPYTHNYSISYIKLIRYNNIDYLMSAGNDGILCVFKLDLKSLCLLEVIKRCDILPYSKINHVEILKFEQNCIQVAVAGVIKSVIDSGIGIFNLDVCL